MTDQHGARLFKGTVTVVNTAQHTTGKESSSCKIRVSGKDLVVGHDASQWCPLLFFLSWRARNSWQRTVPQCTSRKWRPESTKRQKEQHTIWTKPQRILLSGYWISVYPLSLSCLFVFVCFSLVFICVCLSPLTHSLCLCLCLSLSLSLSLSVCTECMCASGAVNMHCFVWKLKCFVHKFSLIYSCIIYVYINDALLFAFDKKLLYIMHQ